MEGELRPGGTFPVHLEADDIESTGRLEVRDPPRRLQVTTRETDESYRRGQGVPPFDATLKVTLTADGDQTISVVEVQDMPLHKIAFYGAGWPTFRSCASPIFRFCARRIRPEPFTAGAAVIVS